MFHPHAPFSGRRNFHNISAFSHFLGCLFIIASIAAFSFDTSPVRAQTFPGKIGAEVGDRPGAWVDIAKTLRQFTTIGGGGNTPIDSNGWPTTDGETVLMDDRPLPAWNPPVDDPAAYQPDESGTFHCSFTGQATVAVSGGSPVTIANQLYNSGANTTTFDMTLPAGTWQTAPALIVLDFTNTKRTSASAVNTGITNLQAIRPGYAANTTQIFTNEFVGAFGPFAHLRFMGWRNTNYQAGYYGDSGHHLLNWVDRELPTDSSQGLTALRPGALGISWEYIILLANQLNKDVWINIPVSATGASPTDTTSYIYQLALLLKNGNAFTGNAGLHAGAHIYIEHSNEVWNFGFSQYTWNKLAAVDEVGIGSTLNNDASTDQEVWAHRRHAKRLREIAKIFEAVYGPGSLNTVIRPVYASWTINPQSYYTDVLNWMNTTYGAPSGYFYAIAGTSYFGETPTDGESIATILANMQANSDSNLTYTQQLRTIANTFGLKLYAYEAGPDNGGGSTTNVGNRILANRDPGMTSVIEHDVRTNYFGIGGADSYNYFTLSSAFTRYGSWGATDDLANINTPKFLAIYNLTGYTPSTSPAAPTGLTATPGNTQITLNWAGSTGATSYSVYRGATPGGELATAIAPGIAATTYTDTGLTNGTTYYYKVDAANAYGTSPKSSEASAIPAVPTIPAAPTGLTAVAGDTQISLSWAASTGATSYNVKRSTVSGSGYVTVSSPVTNSFINTGLTNGTTYYYVVSAVNTAGESANSTQASAKPQLPPPPAPTGLTATPGDSQVALSWTASSGATGYHVKSSLTNGGPYTSVASPSSTSYTNTGLSNGVTYYYVVTAVGSTGESANSAQASATPSLGSILAADPFNAPAGALNGVSTGTGWSGAWAEQNGNTTVPGYNVSSTTPLTFSTLITSGNYAIGGIAYETSGRGLDVSNTGPFSTYLTGGLIGLPGKTLWMSALLRKDAATDQSNYIVLHANNTVTFVNAPLVGVGYFGASSNTSGTRYWSLQIGSTVYQSTVPITVGTAALLVARIDFAATNTITFYVNPGSIGGAAPASAAVTQTTATSMAFKSLAYYGGDGANQSSLDEIRFGDTYAAVTPSTTTPTIPAPPTGLAATAGNAQVALTWNASQGATSYNVWYTTGGNYLSAATGVTGTAFTHTGLTNGVQYTYYVTASNSAGTSAPSTSANATPNSVVIIPIAPAGLVAVRGNAQIVLSWSASSGATSYNVKRSTTSGGPYTTVASPTTANYTNSGLINGTTYYYVVSALNSAGESANSAQASATPTAPVTIPPVPVGLTAANAHAIVLNWSASAGATSYKVKRSTLNGGPYTVIASPTGATSTDPNVAIGAPYFYVVSAVNSAGESGNSGQIVGTLALDFNGDGKADLVLQNATSGQVALWYMNGATLVSGEYTSTKPPTDWYVVGQGDFNGDGKPDLVLQNTKTKQIAIWYMNGANLVSGQYASFTPSNGWYAVAVGDFNRDGKPDLVLQNTINRQVAIWSMNGGTITHTQNVSLLIPAGWYISGAADFNGDGKMDLVLQNTTTHQVAIWYLDGATVTSGGYLSTLLPAGWIIVGVGDFNGDSHPDLVLQNTTTHVISIWYLNGTTVVSGSYVSVTPAAGWRVVGPD